MHVNFKTHFPPAFPLDPRLLRPCSVCNRDEYLVVLMNSGKEKPLPRPCSKITRHEYTDRKSYHVLSLQAKGRGFCAGSGNEDVEEA
jgi:hypothetical protein